MRFLLVTQHFYPYDQGGSGLSVRELALGLVEHGHEVVVLAQAPGARDEESEFQGIRVLHWATANRWSRSTSQPRSQVQRALGQLTPELHWGLHQRLDRFLEQEQPDLVHTHLVAGVSTRLWGLAKARGIPVIHTLRDYYLLCARGTLLRGLDNCTRPCAACRLTTSRRRSHLRNLDGIIGISPYVLERHRLTAGQEFPQECRVIPNGIPGEGGVPIPTSGALRIGYLGRLHESKGIDLLLKEWPSGTGRPMELHVAGSGPADFEARLKALADSSVMTFHGPTKPEEFLPRLDLLVLPSRFEEPFGRVIIEAMQWGLPVLVSRRGGAQALVEEGRTGWIFEPDRPGDLRRALELAANADRAAMAEACRAQAARHSAQRMVQSHLELYSQFVGPECLAGAPPRQPAPAGRALGR